MPKGPRGEKRPGDVIGAAIMVAKIATGEAEEGAPDKARRESGKRGGAARATKLSQQEKRALALRAAKARWKP